MYKIEMQWPGQPRQLWAYHVGTKANALSCARDVLEELRESYGRRASVWINGKRVRLSKKPKSGRNNSSPAKSIAEVVTPCEVKTKPVVESKASPKDKRREIKEQLGLFLKEAKGGD